ncbi:MAG: hypothetical protein IK048_05220 [Clostridia bacterium]|nr:hypothetical protein [Clostridia bacterium]
MFDVEKIVKANAKDGYKIVDKASVSHELFFVGGKTETVRATETEETKVTVYVNNEDGTLGDSTFPVYASMDENALKVALNKALSRAKLVHNKPYALVEGGKEVVELPSNLKGLDGKDVAKQVAKAVFDAEMVKGGSINALEIFVTESKLRVRLSTGLDKTQIKRKISIEAIPTHTDEKESVELYEWYEVTSLNLEDITREISEKMRAVKDRHEAVKGTPQTIDVALRPEEIMSLVETLTDELSYGAKYMESNAYEVGDNLQEGRTGDPLTIAEKAQVEGGSDSAAFDADGTALKDRVVVKDGKAVALWGTSRYGQYIGVKPEDVTGDLGCLSVESGSLEKLDGRYLECASMSGIQVDVYNDYIGGEIRLAYLHEGDKVTPVTGISMSAKLSEVLPTLRLTNDKVVRGAFNYEGPSRMLLKNVQIV